ncbi:MAG: DUF4276 family protein [Anaerolineae bacterium]|nr:DUF4276 family protein [Anaerolineae bacterium]
MTADAMLRKVLVSVEGQTEETFVTEVLRPYLKPRGLTPQPVVLKTRHLPGHAAEKGGSVPYAKVKRELLGLLRDSSAVAITTMYDFYALSRDFPGYATLPSGSGAQRVAHLEAALREDLADRRFHPYLQLHEFESLLFADVEKTHASLLGDRRQLEALRAITREFPAPEDIDEGHTTAPSKRLRAVFPAYQKASDGPLITLEIGLEHLRAACPHFNIWLTWLESLT